MQNTLSKLAALVLKPRLRQFSKKWITPRLALLFWVLTVDNKAHGSSNAIAIKNAIRQGILFLKMVVLERIRAAVTSAEEDEL